jgi:hypothetical protein
MSHLDNLLHCQDVAAVAFSSHATNSTQNKLFQAIVEIHIIAKAQFSRG